MRLQQQELIKIGIKSEKNEKEKRKEKQKQEKKFNRQEGKRLS